MNKPEKLKKYQQKKFEYYKQIDEINISDNEAYITIQINDINEIISQFSIPGHEIIKEEFINLISKKASYIPVDYPLVLEIYTKSLTSEEKILIRKLFKIYYSLETINTEEELKTIKRKSRFFLFVGIICAILFILMVKLNVVTSLLEIISFIASFSIWEFAELVIFEQDDLREKIIKNKHLAKIRIIYNKIN